MTQMSWTLLPAVGHRARGRRLFSLCVVLVALTSPIDAWADPFPLCPGSSGGSVGTPCGEVPIRMVSEDVRIFQDTKNGWWWNVTATYRFESRADEALTLPIVFPSALPESCAVRSDIPRVRVNGKVVFEQTVETVARESAGFGAFSKALAELAPHCAEALELYGSVPDVRQESLRKVGASCERYVRVSSECAAGRHTCFTATFPAKAETAMIITYRYLGMPDGYFRSSEFDREEPGLRAHQFPEYSTHKGMPALPPPRSVGRAKASSTLPWEEEHDPWTVQQSVDFVLSTGALWEGTVGEVKLTIGVRDLPFDLRLCYGSRCARFDADRQENLSGLTASVENSKGRTILTLHGRDVEPDGEVRLRYARQFVDQALVLEHWCDYGGFLWHEWDEGLPTEKLELCKVVPYHYLGYRLKSEKAHQGVVEVLSETPIQLTKHRYEWEGTDLVGTLTWSRASKLGDPASRYHLPKSVTFDQKARLARGFEQLGSVKAFVDHLDKVLASRRGAKNERR